MRRLPFSRIVYFHSVADRHGSTSPDLFRAQLETGLALGLKAVPLVDLVTNVRLGRCRGELAVTFDDGYADNVDCALPILLDLNIPATFFVVSGQVGHRRLNSDDGHLLYPDRVMLSRSDLHALARAGMSIGSHSGSHRLASVEVDEDYDQYVDQLRVSREQLEAFSESSVNVFAYPNGQRGAFSPASRAAIAEAGFSYALTTVWGSARHMVDPLELPRCELRYDRPLRDARSRLLGYQDFRRLVHLTRRGSDRWGR